MLDQQVQGQVLTDKPVVTGTATASAAAFEWHHHQYSSVAMMNLNELDESNLIDMLQVLTKRRDELRLIDKQLFDLMAECFVRLKPAGKELARSSSCSGSSSGFEGSNSSPASSPDDGAMDLSRLAEVTGVGLGATEQLDRSGASYARQEMGGRQEEKQEAVTNKRSNLASPSLHFKKQRLLSAIISTDDIGEKQQVLAEKELDVRNDDDGRPLISNKQQQQQSSFKLIACNSSYQQLNNNNNNQHHREEYHQDQQQQQPQQQAELIGTTQLMGSLAGPSLPAQYREQQFLVDGAQSSSQAIQFQFDSGHTSSASDHDDDSQEQSASIDRPQLKKFCSIGSAEMSFERFSRQQHLIDSTLATLNQSQQQQQPTTTRQANSGMLVPLVKTGDDSQQLMQVATSQQQHHSGASSLGYSIELAPAYSKGAPQAALLAPTATTMMMMMPTAAASTALAQSQNPPDMVHRLYDQFLQCQQKSPSGQLMDPTNQPALIYQQQQQHHLQGHQTPAGCAVPVPLHAVHGRQPRRATGAPSAFEQLLVNAKDLGPIVRKMSFRCHVCSSCFEDRHRLQQHLSIHLNLHPSWFEEKTIKETMAQYEMRRGDYLCQPCQLRFETTSEFDRHMHLHGDKPHQCELCSQENKFVSFRYFRQLLTHLRSHCFLYSCRFVPECRQTANRKDYLKLHILKHHLNNKLPEQYTICCH